MEKGKKEHRPLSTSCVLTNDDPVLENQPLMWLRVEVVNAEIEETLELAGVQIHSDNVVAAGDSQHVGNELGCDGRAALVLFVHACVGVARDHGGNEAGGNALACGDEN